MHQLSDFVEQKENDIKSHQKSSRGAKYTHAKDVFGRADAPDPAGEALPRSPS